MDGGIVLHIAVVPDCDSIGVPADNGIVPYAYIFSCLHIADDMCPGGGKYVSLHDEFLLNLSYRWRYFLQKRYHVLGLLVNTISTDI